MTDQEVKDLKWKRKEEEEVVLNHFFYLVQSVVVLHKGKLNKEVTSLMHMTQVIRDEDQNKQGNNSCVIVSSRQEASLRALFLLKHDVCCGSLCCGQITHKCHLLRKTVRFWSLMLITCTGFLTFIFELICSFRCFVLQVLHHIINFGLIL